jgi:hypothetical protein
MTNYVIKPETGHVYITPTGFLVYAEDFHSAGIGWESDHKYSPVPFFLFCRAIELGLKSFALTKGEKISFLKSRKVGHDLITVLNIAKKHSLSDFVDMTSIDEIEIAKANQYYSDKGFEYFKLENLFDKSKLPDLQVLRNYSEKLLKNIKEFTLSSA